MENTCAPRSSNASSIGLASGSQGRRADGLSSSSRHHDQDVNHPVALARAPHRLDGVITEQTAPLVPRSVEDGSETLIDAL
jgi:hypothetical protein